MDISTEPSGIYLNVIIIADAPDNFRGSQFCVILNWDETEQWLYNDRSCEGEYPYVCKKSARIESTPELLGAYIN